MSRVFGLCWCKSCDECQKATRSRMASCLGGGQGSEEGQQGAVTREPSSAGGTFPPGRGAAGGKGSSGDDSSEASSSISEESAASKKTTHSYSQVELPPVPVSDSPQPGPSGTQPFTHVIHDVPSDYTTSDSETPP